jgi:hypothetical protein
MFNGVGAIITGFPIILSHKNFVLQLNPEGSDPNVARDTLSQYGDHFCEMV